MRPATALTLLFCLAAATARSATAAQPHLAPPVAALLPPPSDASAPACADSRPECTAWATAGECTTNPFFMRPACPRACLVRPVCWPGGSHALPPWTGSATEAGTKSYVTSHPGAAGAVVGATHRRDPALLGSWLAPRQTVRSGPWVWLGGLGLVATGEDGTPAEDVAAAALAGLVGRSVGAGANLLLVDPASRAGADLAAVGDALASLRLEADARARSPQVAARAAVSRSALVLASKAGRLPLPEEGRRAAAWGRMPATELAGPGGRACLHPGECLDPLLNQTLAALNVVALDVLLFDGVFADHGPSQEAEGRLARAFAWAERARAAGRVGAYGVAEETALTRPPSAGSPHASLARLIRLATAAAGGPGHGFRYVCVPAGPGAWTVPSQVLDPSVVAGGALASPPPLAREGGWAAAVAAAGATAGASGPLVPLTRAAAGMGVGVLVEAADRPAALEAARVPGVSAALISAARARDDLEALAGRGSRGSA